MLLVLMRGVGHVGLQGLLLLNFTLPFKGFLGLCDWAAMGRGMPWGGFNRCGTELRTERTQPPDLTHAGHGDMTFVIAVDVAHGRPVEIVMDVQQPAILSRSSETAGKSYALKHVKPMNLQSILPSLARSAPRRLEGRVRAQEVLGNRGGVVILRAIVDAKAHLESQDPGPQVAGTSTLKS